MTSKSVCFVCREEFEYYEGAGDEMYPVCKSCKEKAIEESGKSPLTIDVLRFICGQLSEMGYGKLPVMCMNEDTGVNFFAFSIGPVRISFDTDGVEEDIKDMVGEGRMAAAIHAKPRNLKDEYKQGPFPYGGG